MDSFLTQRWSVIILSHVSEPGIHKHCTFDTASRRIAGPFDLQTKVAPAH